MLEAQSLREDTKQGSSLCTQELKSQLDLYKLKVAQLEELLSRQQHHQHSPWVVISSQILPDESSEVDPSPRHLGELRGQGKQSLFKASPRFHCEVERKVNCRKTKVQEDSWLYFERCKKRQKLKYPPTGAITSRCGGRSTKKERPTKTQLRKIEYQTYTKRREEKGQADGSQRGDKKLQKVKSVPQFQWVTIRDQHQDINGQFQRREQTAILKQQMESFTKKAESLSRNSSPQRSKFREMVSNRVPTSPSLIQHNEIAALTTEETVQKLQEMMFTNQDFTFTEAITMSKEATQEVHRTVNFPRNYRRKVPSPVKNYIEEGRNGKQSLESSRSFSLNKSKEMSSIHLVNQNQEVSEGMKQMITSIKEKRKQEESQNFQLKGVLKISEILKRQNRAHTHLRNKSTESRKQSRSSSLRGIHDLKLIGRVKNW